MFPGSSGSMVIDDNLQVLGIYWGGFDDGTSQNVRYPCGVMFDTQGDWSGSQRPYYNYNKLDVIGRIIGCQL
jgi:hypothetical protein